ncbi:hypothetical protein B484DRAFT_444635 [Ochromonadaceae sp. CCMP2298]|nr:hypothetical protein B484DRAFT_444635 [Ochromonadaceae sp. CCMP2298]
MTSRGPPPFRGQASSRRRSNSVTKPGFLRRSKADHLKNSYSGNSLLAKSGDGIVNFSFHEWTKGDTFDAENTKAPLYLTDSMELTDPSGPSVRVRVPRFSGPRSDNNFTAGRMTLSHRLSGKDSHHSERETLDDSLTVGSDSPRGRDKVHIFNAPLLMASMPATLVRTRVANNLEAVVVSEYDRWLTVQRSDQGGKTWLLKGNNDEHNYSAHSFNGGPPRPNRLLQASEGLGSSPTDVLHQIDNVSRTLLGHGAGVSSSILTTLPTALPDLMAVEVNSVSSVVRSIVLAQDERRVRMVPSLYRLGDMKRVIVDEIIHTIEHAFNMIPGAGTGASAEGAGDRAGAGAGGVGAGASAGVGVGAGVGAHAHPDLKSFRSRIVLTLQGFMPLGNTWRVISSEDDWLQAKMAAHSTQGQTLEQEQQGYAQGQPRVDTRRMLKLLYSLDPQSEQALLGEMQRVQRSIAEQQRIERGSTYNLTRLTSLLTTATQSKKIHETHTPSNNTTTNISHPRPGRRLPKFQHIFPDPIHVNPWNPEHAGVTQSHTQKELDPKAPKIINPSNTGPSDRGSNPSPSRSSSPRRSQGQGQELEQGQSQGLGQGLSLSHLQGRAMSPTENRRQSPSQLSSPLVSLPMVGGGSSKSTRSMGFRFEDELDTLSGVGDSELGSVGGKGRERERERGDRRKNPVMFIKVTGAPGKVSSPLGDAGAGAGQGQGKGQAQVQGPGARVRRLGSRGVFDTSSSKHTVEDLYVRLEESMLP